ncbi:hypothetical protein [Gottfriedia acidiceleris]|uniref:Translation initiation factor 1 n=1 Tax=Gottfriedia acidiceleris TaxID=371036 RepID=A0ABY4JG90_9BACI|nr:hypothetical protein [Gottfriedia acidiceleris]UPM52846.1 hypothetical protein MY490_13510 [Gottfriedia acidiceleris]
MLTIIFTEIKKMWFDLSCTYERFEEIDRLESKHTRVRFDKDIYEIIRVQ